MKPNYVAKKSIWRAITFWRVVFFWLIIPLIVMIIDMIAANKETIEFYDNKIIQRKGIISKSEKQSVFSGVLAISVEQSVLGRIFNYGNVMVDVQGKWDIDTHMISNPDGLKKYLEDKTVNTNSIHYIEHS